MPPVPTSDADPTPYPVVHDMTGGNTGVIIPTITRQRSMPAHSPTYGWDLRHGSGASPANHRSCRRQCDVRFHGRVTPTASDDSDTWQAAGGPSVTAWDPHIVIRWEIVRLGAQVK